MVTEDIRCDWKDQYDDLYTEFAPDPIAVRCTARATYALLAWDPHYPPEVVKYCGLHAVVTKLAEQDSPLLAHDVPGVWMCEDGTHGTW